MMCENVTAELRADGVTVLIIPDEEFEEVTKALFDGEVFSREYAKLTQFDEHMRRAALQAAQCLDRLETTLERTKGTQPPKRPKLRSV